MDKSYRVSFVTKMGGYQPWARDIDAPTAKIARAIAEADWSLSHKEHMFHIVVRRLKDDEEFLYHWFKKTFCQEV